MGEDLKGLHPGQARLRDFALGRCAAEQAAEIGDHLDACPECRDAVGDGCEDDPFVARLRLGYVDGVPAPGSTFRPGPPPPADPGRLWELGDYRILRKIGSGGMGVVYEAEHLALRRRVALKVLHALVAADPRALARFHRETRALAGLHHTNIVPLLEAGRDSGYYFYSMPCIEGRGLDRMLKELGRPPGGPEPTTASGLFDRVSRVTDRTAVGLPDASASRGAEALRRGPGGPDPAASTAAPGGPAYLRGVARLGLQAAEALAFAHDRGIVHRDIKPSNLLLGDDGTVWVTDFGLAHSASEADDLTRSGEILGTMRYLAPEGFAGRADARGDIYSLGLTLYELATLRPAFSAPGGHDLARQVLETDPTPPRAIRPEIPRDLETIVLKAAAREPSGRYPSARAMADDLRRFLDGSPIRARPVSPLGRSWRWARRKPVVAALALALSAALLGGTAASVHLARLADRRAVQAQFKGSEAAQARDLARSAQRDLGRISADLLLDRGRALAAEGRVAEALHWMLAAVRTAPDPGVRRLAGTELAGWAARAPSIVHWLDTKHFQGAFAPDGRTFATCGYDRVVRPSEGSLSLWDLADGRPIAPPVASGDLSIRFPSFSPDGKALLTGNGTHLDYHARPGWARLWDATRGAPIGESRGIHAACVTCAAWLPDGKTCLTGSWDRTVRAWDRSTGRPVGPPMVHPSNVNRIAVSPDGRWLLAMARWSAHLWEVATGEPIGTPIEAPGDREADAVSVGFSGDGRTLIAGFLGDSGRRPSLVLRAWDPERRLLGRPRVVPGIRPDVAILDDGRLVRAESDPDIRDPNFSRDGRWSYRAVDGMQLRRGPSDLSRPADEVDLRGPEQPRATAWEACSTPAAARTWVILPDARSAVALDTRDGRPTAAVVPHLGIWGRPRLAASADGRLVAAASPVAADEPDRIQVYGAADGRPVGPPQDHPPRALAMAFSPDARTLAVGGQGRTIALWDVEDDRPARPPLKLETMVLGLDYSPDGRSLAACTWAGDVRVFDPGTGSPRHPPLPHPEAPFLARHSPDGSRLVSLDRTAAHLWDASTGREVATLPFPKPLDAPREWIDFRATFSPDSSRLLVSNGFSSFRLWDPATGRPLGPPTPLGPVQLSCFAFSPDGLTVAAGHEDGSVQLWDAETTRRLGAPMVQVPGVVGVAFAPDGPAVVTTSADGAVRRWPLPAPADPDLDALELAIQLSTGQRLDESREVVALSRAEWLDRRGRWRLRRGADAAWSTGPGPGGPAWHDARARDAEAVGNPFTAIHHLDRLIEASPDAWPLRLRRRRALLAAGSVEAAGRDERRVAELGGADAMRAWDAVRPPTTPRDPTGEATARP